MAAFTEREINHLYIYKYLWRSSWRPSWRPSLRFGKVAKYAKTAMLSALAIFPARDIYPKTPAILGGRARGQGRRTGHNLPFSPHMKAGIDGIVDVLGMSEKA